MEDMVAMGVMAKSMCLAWTAALVLGKLSWSDSVVV